MSCKYVFIHGDKEAHTIPGSLASGFSSLAESASEAKSAASKLSNSAICLRARSKSSAIGRLLLLLPLLLLVGWGDMAEENRPDREFLPVFASLFCVPLLLFVLALLWWFKR